MWGLKCVYCFGENVTVDHVRSCAKDHHQRQGSDTRTLSRKWRNDDPLNLWRPGGSPGEQIQQKTYQDKGAEQNNKRTPEKIDRAQRRQEAIQATTEFDMQDKTRDLEHDLQADKETTQRWLPGGSVEKRPPQTAYSKPDKTPSGKRKHKGKDSGKRSGRSSSSGQVWEAPAPYGTTDPRYR